MCVCLCACWSGVGDRIYQKECFDTGCFNDRDRVGAVGAVARVVQLALAWYVEPDLSGKRWLGEVDK